MAPVVLGAVLALFQANVAAEQASPPHVVTKPYWTRRPSGNDVAAVFPSAALAGHVQGRVNLYCDVDETGHLQNCVVTEESPPGMGFGRAALALQKDFRMQPETIDGQPASGAHVRIPMIFRLPS